jgi:putative ABC transport system ATP-binding protein
MNPADEVMVTVRGLRKTVGAESRPVDILRDVDLTLTVGEFVAVTGPSGSGKSTLLHLLAGLETPSGGSICFGGCDLATLSDDGRVLLRRQRIAVVFQNFQLLDMLTAQENVALPLAIAGRPRRQANRRAAEALERVGLADRKDHRPDTLSGGEQQRVAVARALVVDPALLLADEPTGNLDSVNSAAILRLFRELGDERRRTIVMVTHDAAQAAQADRTVEMCDGRIMSATGRRLPAEETRSLHAAVGLFATGNTPALGSSVADTVGSGAGGGRVGGGGLGQPVGARSLP